MVDEFLRTVQHSEHFDDSLGAWCLAVFDLGRNYFYFGRFLSTLVEDAAYDIRVA